jgi:hypothetical protein
MKTKIAVVLLLCLFVVPPIVMPASSVQAEQVWLTFLGPEDLLVGEFAMYQTRNYRESLYYGWQKELCGEPGVWYTGPTYFSINYVTINDERVCEYVSRSRAYYSDDHYDQDEVSKILTVHNEGVRLGVIRFPDSYNIVPHPINKYWKVMENWSPESFLGRFDESYKDYHLHDDLYLTIERAGDGFRLTMYTLNGEIVHDSDTWEVEKDVYILIRRYKRLDYSESYFLLQTLEDYLEKFPYRTYLPVVLR